ncbi:MAG: hypothetical protein Pg6C_06390 [Treponemataceae bacterium]|nr:MAG: hypothetical protein Pg6C_06390 [Treponemataceae bacterium]
MAGTFGKLWNYYKTNKARIKVDGLENTIKTDIIKHPIKTIKGGGWSYYTENKARITDDGFGNTIKTDIIKHPIKMCKLLADLLPD